VLFGLREKLKEKLPKLDLTRAGRRARGKVLKVGVLVDF
jgi:hypothetical protein